jgi:cytochrome c oxidase subunit 4
MARAQTSYLLVYLGLLVLLGATIGSAQLQLGIWNPVINLAIATVKAVLIAWVFMHLRESSGLVRLFAVGALFWLLALIALGLADWLTRG